MTDNQPRKGTKRQPRENSRTKEYVFSTVIRWVIVLAAFAVILLNLFTNVLQVVRYNGQGMEPNLHNRQTLVLLQTQKVKDGDIIAFYYNNQVLVRRVICHGGNQIIIEENGAVSVNGNTLDEPYLKNPSFGQCNLSFPYYVPVNHVFVMGDYREIAMDSRLKEIGSIPTERIIGKVLFAF